jgi:hypothetical protein
LSGDADADSAVPSRNSIVGGRPDFNTLRTLSPADDAEAVLLFVEADVEGRDWD